MVELATERVEYGADGAGAFATFRRVVDTSYRPAFGFIASEAEIARRGA